MLFGRQREPGRPRPADAACFIRAKVSGREGLSSGLKSQKRLNTYLETLGRSICKSKNPGGKARVSSLRGVASASQRPERSGLPLRRGAGAVKLGLPSLVRGVRGSE